MVLTLTGQETPEGEIEVTATRLSGEVAASATLPCHEKLKHLAVVLARDLDLPPYKFKLVVDGVPVPPTTDETLAVLFKLAVKVLLMINGGASNGGVTQVAFLCVGLSGSGFFDFVRIDRLCRQKAAKSHNFHKF